MGSQHGELAFSEELWMSETEAVVENEQVYFEAQVCLWISAPCLRMLLLISATVYVFSSPPSPLTLSEEEELRRGDAGFVGSQHGELAFSKELWMSETEAVVEKKQVYFEAQVCVWNGLYPYLATHTGAHLPPRFTH